MSYTALYRKFRPDRFSEVKGQDAIITTLKNQILADRISHAYLFSGSRGTGKTTVAKIFARAVNCEHPVNGDPCNECPTCRAIAQGASLNVIEIDGASNNSVDNIRRIREEVAYSPTTGRFKVYIIDEVHMLSASAFNALLKTLEEPPGYVIFILATTDPHKLPLTILSRCQRFDFKRLPQGVITDRLRDLLTREEVGFEEKALRYIARKAEGGMRDALSLADQCISFYLGQTLTYERVLDLLGAVDADVFSQLLREVLDGDVKGLFQQLDQLIMQGRDITQLVNDFLWYLRNLMLLKATDQLEDSLDVSAENLERLKEEAQKVKEETLMRYIRIFSELANQLRYATNRRVLLEVAFLKLAKPQMQRDELSLTDRVRQLEEQLERLLASPPNFSSDTARKGSVPSEDAIPWKESALPDQRFSGGGQRKAERNEEKIVQYRQAAPKDLQQIKTMWNSIIEGAGKRQSHELARVDLKFCQTQGCENQLYVIFPDFLGESYLKNEDRKALLEQLIAEKTGKKVEVCFALAEDELLQTKDLKRIEVEEILERNIHMNVEIEE